MKHKQVDLLVSGAGPVGLAAALFAHEAGLKTAVIDSKPNGATHSYALALHPATLELFQDPQIVSEILKHSKTVSSIAVYTGGRRIATVPVAPEGARHPFLAVLGQDVLESTLVRVLERRGVPVLWSHRLARFTADAEKVAVDVDELEERVIGYASAHLDWLVRGTHTVETGYLVGADGHESLVRRQLGIEFPETGPAEYFAVFEFQTDGTPLEEVSIVLHQDGMGVLWPLPNGRARWGFSVSASFRAEALREKEHEPVQLFGPGAYPALEEHFFRRLLAERAPWSGFNAHVGHMYWRMLVRFEHRLAPSFGSGRIWLAGDAGHLTGPVGVQSMNVGLREVIDLAAHLKRVNTGERDAGSLRSYNRARQEEWKFLLGQSGVVTTVPGTADEIVRAARGLVGALPASGRPLIELAARLGINVAP